MCFVCCSKLLLYGTSVTVVAGVLVCRSIVIAKNVTAYVWQQQHLIELIRKRKVEEALAFAQAHLAERGEENEQILAELEKSLALLAFENPENSPFAELLHPAHKQKV